MITNNYSFNSPGKKIHNENETIVNDEKFITLINNLSGQIKSYYNSCKSNNNEIFQSFLLYEKNSNYLISLIKDTFATTPPSSGLGEFLKIENNIKAITTKFHENFDKNKEILKFFIEEAKEIFKQMKYLRYEKINNYVSKISNNSNNLMRKKFDSNSYAKNKNTMETFRLNDIKTNSKFRIKEDNNILNNNTLNTNTYNYYNSTNITNNIDSIKYLLKKFSEYNNIIGNISLKAKENYINLQNAINIELDKCNNYNCNHRKSFNFNNNDSNENSYINNISFNYISNNDKFNHMKKTLFRDFSSNKTRSQNNINNFNDDSYEILINKNSLYKNQIKHLEFQIEDLKSTINILEKTLYDSNNQLNKLTKDKKINIDTNNIKDNNININELKKINNNLLQKIKINEMQLNKINKEIISLKQENIKYKLKNNESSSELTKQKEYINKLEIEIKENKINNNKINNIEEKKDNIEEKINMNLNLNTKNDNSEIINLLNKDYEIKIKNLNEQNSTLSKTIIDKQNEIENLINKNVSLNNEIVNLKDIIDNNSKNDNEKIKEYKDKMNNNNKLIENLNELLNKEKNSNKENNKIINKYQKEINDLKKENENNKSLIKDNNKIINDLKKEKTELSNENIKLKKKISINEDENKVINDLKEEKIELNNQLISLKNKISTLEQEKMNIEKSNDVIINNKNEEIQKTKNKLEEKEKDTNKLKDRVNNLESQYDKLKLKEDNIIIENESLIKELNIYKNKCDKLQIDFNLKNYNLTKELNELKKKNNIINDESKQINEYKLEKEKMLQIIMEYKNIKELNNQQIKALKEHIKELEKKLNNNISKNENEIYEGNDDAIEEYNKIRILYDEQVNKNKELENKIHYKDEQIEGLKIVVNKFADEKISFNEKKKSSHNSNSINLRYNNDYDKDDEKSFINDKDTQNKLKEAKIIINKLIEEKTALETQIKSLKDNNKLLHSEYKSEGGIEISREGNEEEEYTMKKMVKGAKKRNQSEDIKIDYPGLSDMKQKYEELEKKFRNLEQAVINLLNNIKCNSEIKSMIIDVCKALEISDDMVKEIIKEE